MRATAPRHRPIQYRPRRQARPRYHLRELKPLPIQPWRFSYVREAVKLIVSVAFVIAAVLIWTVRPWL